MQRTLSALDPGKQGLKPRGVREAGENLFAFSA